MKYQCPSCNHEVSVGIPCPICSSKNKQIPAAPKSWKQDKHVEGLDLPDEDFDYDDFVKKEFGRSPHNKIGIKWYWYVVAILIVLYIVLRGFYL
jgi:hypothetical protein